MLWPFWYTDLHLHALFAFFKQVSFKQSGVEHSLILQSYNIKHLGSINVCKELKKLTEKGPKKHLANKQAPLLDLHTSVLCLSIGILVYVSI